MLILILEECDSRARDAEKVFKAGPGPPPPLSTPLVFSFQPLPLFWVLLHLFQFLLPSLPAPFSAQLSGVAGSVPMSSAPISLCLFLSLRLEMALQVPNTGLRAFPASSHLIPTATHMPIAQRRKLRLRHRLGHRPPKAVADPTFEPFAIPRAKVTHDHLPILVAPAQSSAPLSLRSNCH